MFQHPHLDAYGNAIFAEKLQSARVQSYDQRFPELLGRTFVPIDNSEDPGVETIAVESYTTAGSFKLISAYADDLPRSDVLAEKTFVEVRDLGGSYGYNIKEVRNSVFAGKPLPPMKAAAARRSYEQAVDVLIALGDTKSGLYGLLTQPNVTAVTLAAGAGVGANVTWATKTAAEKYADLVFIRRQVQSVTNGIEDINTIIMPPDQYAMLEDEAYSENSDSSILDMFREKNPGVDVFKWHRAKGAGSGGTDRIVAYRKDPNYIRCVIPLEMEELEPEQRNLETLINAWSRFGGVICNFPLSMAYADGV